jgi:hypothetical protein
MYVIKAVTARSQHCGAQLDLVRYWGLAVSDDMMYEYEYEYNVENARSPYL